MPVVYFFVSAHYITKVEIGRLACVNVTDLLTFGNFLNSLTCTVFYYLTQANKYYLYFFEN